MGLLSRFFSGGRSEKRDTTFQGPKPFSSITKAALGGQLKDTLERRIRGEGLGIPGEPGRTFGSNIANRIRGRFQSRVRPELESELTNLGIRRSSGGFNRLADQVRQNELDAGAVMDEIDLKNELLKRRELSEAIARGQQFNLADANQLGRFAAFEKQLHDDQINQEDARRKALADANKQIVDTGIALATGFGAGGFGGGTDLLGVLKERLATTPISANQFRGNRSFATRPRGITDPSKFIKPFRGIR